MNEKMHGQRTNNLRGGSIAGIAGGSTDELRNNSWFWVVTVTDISWVAEAAPLWRCPYWICKNHWSTDNDQNWDGSTESWKPRMLSGVIYLLCVLQSWTHETEFFPRLLVINLQWPLAWPTSSSTLLLQSETRQAREYQNTAKTTVWGRGSTCRFDPSTRLPVSQPC